MKIYQLLREKILFQRSIITNNTGVSSKSYVMIKGMKLTQVIVYWYLIMLTIEMFTDYVLRSNWLDFVAVIGALAVFVLASAWGKIKGEQNYWDNGYSNNIPPFNPSRDYNSDLNNDENPHE